MLLLSGCWNRRELNELSVVLAMRIDKGNGQYELSVQVVDPTQMSRNRASDRSPTIIYSEKAPTLFEALRKMTTQASRKMYLSHLRILIVDENTAKKGINEPLDLLFRDHEVRPDFYLAVARDCKAKDILELVTPMEVLPALDLYKSLEVSEKAWAPTSAVNVVDIMQRFTKEGIEPVLTGIKLFGNLEKGKSIDNVKQPRSLAGYKYSGIGLFQEDRLIGWLNEADSKAFAYIGNKVSSTVGRVKCPRSNGEFVTEVTRSKIKITPEIKANQPSIRLQVFGEVNVGEIQCSVEMKDEAAFLRMEAAAKATLEKILRDGIHKAQAYGTDIFGFGEAFHQKYPQQWHQWKKDWSQMFKHLSFEIDMDGYHLRKMGKIINPFFDKPPTKE